MFTHNLKFSLLIAFYVVLSHCITCFRVGSFSHYGLTIAPHTVQHETFSTILSSSISKFHKSSIVSRYEERSRFGSRLFAEEKAVTIAAENTMSDEFKRSAAATVKWVGAAAAFGAGIAMYKGVPSAVEYCSGYVLEQCLSVDNLFVFLVLFDYFNLNQKQQEHVLGFGIWGAVVLRGIFIALGAVALSSFHQVLLLFAGILLFSSYKILFADEDGDGEDPTENPIIKFASSLFPTTDKLDGTNFFTVEGGVQKATPLLICLIGIEFSDVIFALDSVPAVFGVTEDPLIVFSSNIFAIAGLRSLYGVLSKAVEELEYLEKAVGVILAIIATKMGLETFDINILSPLQTLGIVIGLLGAGVGFSLNSRNSSSNSDSDSDTSAATTEETTGRSGR